MASPLGLTKANAEACFESAGTLDELLDELSAGDKEMRNEGKSVSTKTGMSEAPIRYSWDRDKRTNRKQ
jgi:hypothetical protein